MQSLSYKFFSWYLRKGHYYMLLFIFLKELHGLGLLDTDTLNTWSR